MADHPPPLEVLAGIEARRVDERDDRQVERVAEPHEASALLRRRDVERPCDRDRLVRHDADRPARDRRERGDEVGRPPLSELEELAFVDDGADDLADVVAPRRRARQELARLGCEPVRRIVGRPEGRRLVHVRGQVRQEQRDHLPCGRDVVDDERRRAGVASVHVSATELGRVDAHAGELGDHRRAADERVGIARHHDEIREPEQQGRA